MWTYRFKCPSIWASLTVDFLFEFRECSAGAYRQELEGCDYRRENRCLATTEYERFT